MTFPSFMLTAGGLGHMRPASGTWGSLPPPALAVLMVWAMDGPHWTIEAALVMCGLAFSYACVKYGADAEQMFGKKDPGQVVADEVAGQVLPLLFLPWVPMVGGGTDAVTRNLGMAAIAFVTFRIFDILKPPPANGLQRLRGGWGILVDDLIAGVYAAIATQVVVRLIW